MWEDGPPMRDSVPWMRWVLCALTVLQIAQLLSHPPPCISAQGCCPPWCGDHTKPHTQMPSWRCWNIRRGSRLYLHVHLRGRHGFWGPVGKLCFLQLCQAWNPHLAYVRYFHLYLHKQLFWSYKETRLLKQTGPDRNVTLGASTPKQVSCP